MTWRSVVVTKKCKLSYKNGYLIVRDSQIEMIHLSEINTIVVDSTMVSITSYLIVELVNKKIKIIFCDHERNPLSEIIPYYGKFNCSKSISVQKDWVKDYQEIVWTRVISEKINNQALLLKKYHFGNYIKLKEYNENLKLFDPTNREGHAAKVYFNTLFGTEFNRDLDCVVNHALNYGYSILLSNFNKEIVSYGYLTQIGLKHCNEFNYFNLSSDLMEPYRILVDEIVYNNIDDLFNLNYKFLLIDLLNQKISINGKKLYLTNAISMYVRSVLDVLRTGEFEKMIFYDFI